MPCLLDPLGWVSCLQDPWQQEFHLHSSGTGAPAPKALGSSTLEAVCPVETKTMASPFETKEAALMVSALPEQLFFLFLKARRHLQPNSPTVRFLKPKKVQ